MVALRTLFDTGLALVFANTPTVKETNANLTSYGSEM